MTYTKQTWKDGTADYTPITAAKLNHMEDGIDAAHKAWDSVSQVDKIELGIGKFARRGGMVSYSVRGNVKIDNAWGTAAVCTLPAGWRPVVGFSASAQVQDNGAASVVLNVQEDGVVSLAGKGGVVPGATWMFAAGSYVVA